MIVAVASYTVSFLACVAVERLAAASNSPGVSPWAMPARLAIFGLLYLFWLGFWGRPILAGMACLVTLAIMTAISIRKRQLVGEPLSFSDFGLLGLIVEHPDLYYTEFMLKPAFLAGAAAFLAAVGMWLWLEPAYGVLSGPASWLLAAAILVAIALVWRVAPNRILANPLQRIVPRPALDRHVARWGLLTTLVAYALRWRAETTQPYVRAERHGPLPLAEAAAFPSNPPDLVVLVQFESFLDPSRLGIGELPLPGLARARDLALLHGPLRVPAHGAFTMRTEHALLTGLSPADLGFRSFDPYLSRRGPAPSSLAHRLAARGYRTLFIHPFRATFFGRDKVVPRLGFEASLYEGDFAGAERFGPYVSDRAMAQRILAEADRPGGAPALVTAITMENHGPWTTDRFAEEPDPRRQYLNHLVHADEAIATLIDGLSARANRTLLCIYGDHPPILPGIVPSLAAETDYAMLILGGGSRSAPTPARSLSADELGRAVMQVCGVLPQRSS